MTVRWDGTTCRIEGQPPTAAGLTSVRLINDSNAPADLLFGGVKAPRTWEDAVAFIRAADLGDPKLVVPDWLIQAQGDVMADARSTASGFVTLPAGNLGALCATGTFPDLEFFDAGAFSVGG